MKVVVIRNDLTYRIIGYNKDRPFIPKVGDILDLPKSIVRLELKTKNVRLPLEEEKTKRALNKRHIVSKKSEEKKVENG